MNSNAQVTPILPVLDVTRAASFYRDRLGLKDLGDEPGGNHVLQTGSGATIALMTAEEGGLVRRHGGQHSLPSREHDWRDVLTSGHAAQRALSMGRRLLAMLATLLAASR